jgi:catechol 2,3-dioxygenase-like lactoylglutathione lyase family enzyme
MTSDAHGPVISVMLAVPDAAAAARWYARGLGAALLHLAQKVPLAGPPGVDLLPLAGSPRPTT